MLAAGDYRFIYICMFNVVRLLGDNNRGREQLKIPGHLDLRHNRLKVDGSS